MHQLMGSAKWHDAQPTPQANYIDGLAQDRSLWTDVLQDRLVHLYAETPSDSQEGIPGKF
eukprot:1244962-Amphidinium_carterae.1